MNKLIIQEDISEHQPNFEQRLQKNFDAIEFFVLKYKFSDMNIDKLNEQSLNYCLLSKEDIPRELKKRME